MAHTYEDLTDKFDPINNSFKNIKGNAVATLLKAQFDKNKAKHAKINLKKVLPNYVEKHYMEFLNLMQGALYTIGIDDNTTWLYRNPNDISNFMLSGSN